MCAVQPDMRLTATGHILTCGSYVGLVDFDDVLANVRAPEHLLAYVESVGDRYLVISLVPPLGGVTEVETLADAEAAVEQLRAGAGRTSRPRV